MEDAFPRYCYGDIVEAQHRLVTKGLGLGRLRLIFRTGMGSMQTWMWGERYPEMMDAPLPIASLPNASADETCCGAGYSSTCRAC